MADFTATDITRDPRVELEKGLHEPDVVQKKGEDEDVNGVNVLFDNGIEGLKS